MKKTPKMSRNRQRKAAYAAKANAGSRNQQALEKPIIGRLERVFHDPLTGKPCPPYERVVHPGDEKVTPSDPASERLFGDVDKDRS